MTAMTAVCTRALIVALSTAMAACTTTVLDPPQAVLVPPVPETVKAPLPQPRPEPVAQRILVLPPHLDPDSELYRNRSVFFAFDDWALRREDGPIVEMHGNYLWRYPELHVRVEGHTDDRGGREYNLALGERRAHAVKAAMQLFGARDEQVETVSYGEEKPRSLGADEDSRARNRRADIVYRRTSR